MSTDLTALHANLVRQLDLTTSIGLDLMNATDCAARGALLSGIAAALAAVRVELDREQEADAQAIAALRAAGSLA